MFKENNYLSQNSFSPVRKNPKIFQNESIEEESQKIMENFINESIHFSKNKFPNQLIQQNTLISDIIHDIIRNYTSRKEELLENLPFTKEKKRTLITLSSIKYNEETASKNVDRILFEPTDIGIYFLI